MWYICLVPAGLGNSSKPQIRLNEGRTKNKALGYDSDQQIHNFTESSGEWIYVVDVVKLSNFGGGAKPKRKNTDFYAGRECSGCRGIRGDQSYDAFQSIGPSPDSKTPF